MKIQTATGTPIWLAKRRDDEGLIIRQGTSHLLLSPVEAGLLLDAIKQLVGLPHIQRFTADQ